MEKWLPFYQACATGVLHQPDSKKAARHEAGGFFEDAPQAAHHSVNINASRIALRDVLCADQLFYVQLHAHRE